MLPSLRLLPGIGRATLQCKFSVNFLRPKHTPVEPNITHEQFNGARLMTVRHKPNDPVLPTLENIKFKLGRIQTNDMVKLVFYRLNQLDLLSSTKALGGAQTSEAYQTVLSLVDSFPKQIKDTEKIHCVYFNGDLTNAAYSVFAGAQYRFGTDATSYQVRGLRQGVLPVGAGLGHHLVQCSTTDGVALARFLAISEKRLDAEEMFDLGMVTHMADDESPQDIANGLAWTRPKDMDFTQAEQVAMDTDLIEEVLETINAESEDIEETYQDELWDDLLSIPPKAVDEIEDAETVDGYPRIENLDHFITSHFQSHDIHTVKTALSTTANADHPDRKVAARCLEAMEAIDMEVLKNWWFLTRQGKNSLKEYSEIERKVLQGEKGKREPVKKTIKI